MRPRAPRGAPPRIADPPPAAPHADPESADGSGGDGVNGGNGTGGVVNLQASANGSLSAAFLGASADGFGGSGFAGGTGAGGRRWVATIRGADVRSFGAVLRVHSRGSP